MKSWVNFFSKKLGKYEKLREKTIFLIKKKCGKTKKLGSDFHESVKNTKSLVFTQLFCPFQSKSVVTTKNFFALRAKSVVFTQLFSALRAESVVTIFSEPNFLYLPNFWLFTSKISEKLKTCWVPQDRLKTLRFCWVQRIDLCSRGCSAFAEND